MSVDQQLWPHSILFFCPTRAPPRGTCCVCAFMYIIYIYIYTYVCMYLHTKVYIYIYHESIYLMCHIALYIPVWVCGCLSLTLDLLPFFPATPCLLRVLPLTSTMLLGKKTNVASRTLLRTVGSCHSLPGVVTFSVPTCSKSYIICRSKSMKCPRLMTLNFELCRNFEKMIKIY